MFLQFYNCPIASEVILEDKGKINRYITRAKHNKLLQCWPNGLDGVSNHRPLNCLLNRLFRARSNKTPKLRVTGLCERNSPVTGEFPAQRVSNAENVSIWWRHHGFYRIRIIILVPCSIMQFFHFQWSNGIFNKSYALAKKNFDSSKIFCEEFYINDMLIAVYNFMPWLLPNSIDYA